MLISYAYAQSGGGSAGGFDIISLLPLVLIFVVFYFLLIRPQQKKAKDHREMISKVRRGDKVLTGGGIYGKVIKVTDEHFVQIEISEGVKGQVARPTIANVIDVSEPSSIEKSDANEIDKLNNTTRAFIMA